MILYLGSSGSDRSSSPGSCLNIPKVCSLFLSLNRSEGRQSCSSACIVFLWSVFLRHKIWSRSSKGPTLSIVLTLEDFKRQFLLIYGFCNEFHYISLSYNLYLDSFGCDRTSCLLDSLDNPEACLLFLCGHREQDLRCSLSCTSFLCVFGLPHKIVNMCSMSPILSNSVDLEAYI